VLQLKNLSLTCCKYKWLGGFQLFSEGIFSQPHQHHRDADRARRCHLSAELLPAESGVVQAAQLLNNTTNRTTLLSRPPAWRNALADVETDADDNIDAAGIWFASSGGSQTGQVSTLSALSPGIPASEYAAVALRAAASQSLWINTVKVHNNVPAGIGNRCDRCQTTVPTGFRKRC
jgi:hypothetical protein